MTVTWNGDQITATQTYPGTWVAENGHIDVCADAACNCHLDIRSHVEFGASEADAIANLLQHYVDESANA